MDDQDLFLVAGTWVVLLEQTLGWTFDPKWVDLVVKVLFVSARSQELRDLLFEEVQPAVLQLKSPTKLEKLTPLLGLQKTMLLQVAPMPSFQTTSFGFTWHLIMVRLTLRRKNSRQIK